MQQDAAVKGGDEMRKRKGKVFQKLHDPIGGVSLTGW